MTVAAVPQSLVDEVRNAILKEINEKGEDKVHPKDLERVKNDDHWLRRFIAHNEQKVPETIKMMWTCLSWRKDFHVNEINENNIKMEIIIKGGFFPNGKDIDGKYIMILKSKLHQKGQVDPEELKRCVVYWFERLERMSKGDQISIFFDMEGCGLSNLDMDFTKYLIGLFKEYYPFFLNYILIYEMPWVLSAAFKIIKSWLPEKAIEKIKFVSKKDLSNFVPKSEALKCWGGDNDYVFSFIPEEKSEVVKNHLPEVTTSTRKVHFVDGSPMSEQPPAVDSKEDGPLKVDPTGFITFVREGKDLVSTLELYNSDSTVQLAFKLKTTSPEKFKVKPSTGCLKPGARDTVTVTLLPGFQLGGLSKDKFLILSSVLAEEEISGLDLAELWKLVNYVVVAKLNVDHISFHSFLSHLQRDTSNRTVYQTRRRCIQSGEVTKNGNVVINHATTPYSESDSQLSKLTATLTKISENQTQLSSSIKRLQLIQLGTFFFSFIVGIAFMFMMNGQIEKANLENGYCRDPGAP